MHPNLRGLRRLATGAAPGRSGPDPAARSGTLARRPLSVGVRGSGAFSLIELLASIGIMMMVASLLLPALSRAKGMARQVRCMSCSYQMSLGVMMYVDENAQVFPASTDYSLPVQSPERLWTTRLLPYVGGVGAFLCPGAPESAFVTNWECRGSGSIGYSTATALDPTGKEGFAERLPVSVMESPALTPLFGDTPGGPTTNRYRGYVFDPYNGARNAVDAKMGTPLVSEADLVEELWMLPPARLKPLHARHRKGLTLLFGDGHGEWVSCARILAQDRGAGYLWCFRDQAADP